MSNSKIKSKKKNNLQEWWERLSSPMKVAVASGLIAGCFGLCIAMVTIAGSIYLAFLNYNLNNTLNNPPAKTYLYPLATNHLSDYYEGIGCIYNVWAIAKDNPSSNQIIEGKPFSPENIDGLAIVSPIYTYFTLEADLADGEFITVENIKVIIEEFENPENGAILIVPTSICAGSDPGFPNLSGIFPVRISPKNKQVSLTEARETKPSDLIYTVTTDTPLRYKLYINSLDPGWYTITVQANYYYKGKRGVVNLDKPIVLYVPDENYISGMFYADWNDNDNLKVLDNKTQVEILSENRKLRENWIIMTLETPIRNPEVSGEYLRIENLGLEQDMTGWAIEGRNIGSDNPSTPAFTFPNFILPEWGAVRVWSGNGNNKRIDLYWNLDQEIWSGITEFTNIVLLNKSDEIMATLFIDPNTLKP